MPSTLVHVALAGLVGTALLADHFDWRAILVVMVATAAIDLDVFVGLAFPGTHRAAFHTLLLPIGAALLLAYDLRYRERSSLLDRWGPRGVRVAWVSVGAVTLAGIGPDLFFNGANVFYPLHDRFYVASGEVIYSTERGFVQTLFELDLRLDFLSEGAAEGGTGTGGASNAEQAPPPSTENTHYSTGLDPSRGAEKQSVERVFHIFATGERFLLALTGYLVVGLRIWMDRADN